MGVHFHDYVDASTNPDDVLNPLTEPEPEPAPRVLFGSGHDVVLRWLRAQKAVKKAATMLGIRKNIRFDGCLGCGRGA